MSMQDPENIFLSGQQVGYLNALDDILIYADTDINMTKGELIDYLTSQFSKRQEAYNKWAEKMRDE